MVRQRQASDLTLWQVAPSSCPCELNQMVDWPLVLDADAQHGILTDLLYRELRRACVNCGRALDIIAPVFVVGDRREGLCWRRDPTGPGIHADRDLAAAHLIGLRQSRHAAEVMKAAPLNTVQLRAVLLIDPEVNLALARPAIFRTADAPAIDRMLDAAEARHRALGGADCANELIHAQTYTTAVAIRRSHPVLGSRAAQRELSGAIRRLRGQGKPNRAADLKRILSPGKAPRLRVSTPSAVVLEHVRAAGREIAAGSVGAFDAYLDTRRTTVSVRPTPELRDQTWFGLTRAIALCRTHTLECPCPEAILELLGRARSGTYDIDVVDMLGELSVWLVDAAEGGPNGLLEVAEAVYLAMANMLRGRDGRRYARTRLNTAVLYNKWSSGDVEARLRDGERAALEAQSFFDREHHPEDWAKAAQSLGVNFSRRVTGDDVANVRQAISWFERALEVFTRDVNPPAHVRVQQNLALLLATSGSRADLDRATAMLEDSRAFDATSGHRSFWRADTSVLALALVGAGPDHWPRAEALLLELLDDIDRWRQPDMWGAVARQAAYLQAAQIKRAGGTRRDLAAYGGPLGLLFESLATATATGSNRGIRAAGELLGPLLLEVKDAARAADVLVAAVEAAEEIRLAQSDRDTRLAERRGDEGLYLTCALAQLSLARPLAAAVVLEWLRARELVDDASGSMPRQPGEQDVIGALVPGRAALYVWGQHAGTAALLLLPDADRGFRSIAAHSQLLTVPAVGDLWGRAVVRNGGTSAQGQDQGGLRAVGVSIGEVGSAPALELLRAPLDELGAVLGPALTEAGTTSVAVIACGPLGNVPWGLMRFGDGRRLGDVCETVLVPSLTWLGLPRNIDERAAPTVVIADTDARPGRSLPYADAEAEDLAALPATERLRNAETIRSALLQRLESARCLHVACHGEMLRRTVATGRTALPVTMSDRLADAVASDERRVNKTEPPTVSIRLAGGELLGPADLLARRIRTRIVVLAGCDTAVVARQEVSDEMWGLPGAFLAAGAGAVVAALWPVDDRSAALFMIRFHRLLALGEPVGSALRRTQDWLRRANVRELSSVLAGLSHLGKLDWPWRSHAPAERPYEREEHWAGY